MANSSPRSPPVTSPSPTTIFLLGISGPSSGGKTTLAHLLRHVFTPYVSLILHGDDFCKDISLIPTVNGYVDADGINGVDFPKMARVLDHIKSNAGAVPDSFAGWQLDVYADQEENALKLVPSEQLGHLKRKVEGQLTSRSKNFKIVVIEGFMLYNMSQITQKLDHRLFVRLDYREAHQNHSLSGSCSPLLGNLLRPQERAEGRVMSIIRILYFIVFKSSVSLVFFIPRYVIQIQKWSLPSQTKFHDYGIFPAFISSASLSTAKILEPRGRSGIVPQ